MKVKEDILKWREEIRKLSMQMSQVNQLTQTQNEEITKLKEQVNSLVKLTEEMTNSMLSLIRLQLGD